MDLIFEILVELILDLVIEGGMEVSTNKKVAKIIRYPLFVLVVLFFSAVILGVFLAGLLLWKKNRFFGLFIIIVSIILLFSVIYKFKKVYMEKKHE